MMGPPLNQLRLCPEPFLQATDSTPKSWFEHVIDGVTLSELLQSGNDFVGRLLAGPPSYLATEVDRLLLRIPADTPEGRTMFYVCPQCGDIGCGVITAIVEEVAGVIRWRDFAYETDWDNGPLNYSEFAHVGPFNFHEGDYTKALLSIRSAVV